MRSRPAGRRDLVVVVVAAALGGAAIRLATAPYFSLWGDELATLKWARLPVAELLRTFGEGATSHLYLLFMKA